MNTCLDRMIKRVSKVDDILYSVAVLSNILYCFNHSYEICAVENEACFIAFNKVYKITTTLVDIYNLIISLIN